MFLRGNHVRSINYTSQKDEEGYFTKYQCKPTCCYVWLGASSGLGKNEDKETEYGSGNESAKKMKRIASPNISANLPVAMFGWGHLLVLMMTRTKKQITVVAMKVIRF